MFCKQMSLAKVLHIQSPCPVDDWNEEDSAATVASFKQYLWSIVYMPSSLRYV